MQKIPRVIIVCLQESTLKIPKIRLFPIVTVWETGYKLSN